MKDYLVSSIESTLSAIDLYIHLRQNKRASDHLSSVSKRARLKYHSILLAIVRRLVLYRFQSNRSTLPELNRPPTLHAIHHHRFDIVQFLVRRLFPRVEVCIVEHIAKKISKKYSILQRIIFI